MQERDILTGVQLRDILAGVQLRDILAGVHVCVLTWKLILARPVPCQCKHGFKFRIDGNNKVYLNVSIHRPMKLHVTCYSTMNQHKSRYPL